MKKILVFNPSFIGDSILTTPLIKYLKFVYPESKIYFCVRPESASLFEGLSFVDEVLVYDKRGEKRGVRGIFSFIKKLNETKFDLVISAHKSLRSSIIVNFLKAELKVGFKESVMNFVYSNKVKRDMKLHEVERNLMLASELLNNFRLEEAKQIAGLPEVAIDEEFYRKLMQYLRISAGGRKIVGFAPTSNWKTKIWPAEKYAFLVNKLYEKNIYSMVFAARSEMDDYIRFRENVKVPFFDFSLKTSLKELSSAIKAVDLIVCNDSAPLHIAVAHNKNVLSFFGPTVPEFGFYPYGSNGEVIEIKGLYCRPCHIHGKNRCPEGHFRCMNDIDENFVLDKILTCLDVK